MFFYLGKAKNLRSSLAKLMFVIDEMKNEMNRVNNNKYLLFYQDKITVINFDEVMQIDEIYEQEKLFYFLIKMSLPDNNIILCFSDHGSAEKIRNDIINNMKSVYTRISENERMRELGIMRDYIDKSRSGLN